MTDSEQIKLYAELLWWWLILLAAFSPLVLVGIMAMVLRMSLMRKMMGPR